MVLKVINVLKVLTGILRELSYDRNPLDARVRSRVKSGLRNDSKPDQTTPNRTVPDRAGPNRMSRRIDVNN